MLYTSINCQACYAHCLGGIFLFAQQPFPAVPEGPVRSGLDPVYRLCGEPAKVRHKAPRGGLRGLSRLRHGETATLLGQEVRPGDLR